MFEYILEVISIYISIKILKRIGNYLKDKKYFEIELIGYFIKFVYWGICFFVMFIVWVILLAIFGYNKPGDLEVLILFSSINGFSSRYFGKTAFWILLIFTFLIGVSVNNNHILGIIVAMVFFFATRRGYKNNEESIKIESLDPTNDMNLLNSYLLKAKEFLSEALNDYQNNNLNSAIEKWSKSLEYYKKAEKIAKSNKDKELISALNNNIKSVVCNILDTRIKLVADKIEKFK